MNLFDLGSHPVMDVRYPGQAMTERALRLWESSQDDDEAKTLRFAKMIHSRSLSLDRKKTCCGSSLDLIIERN